MHRGINGKYQLPKMNCFYRPQLILFWSKDASPETLPAMVLKVGFEPTRLAATDFESAVSAYSIHFSK